MNKLFDERRTAIVKSRIAKRKHKNKCVICKGEIKKVNYIY